jgi:hypothetical protein
VCTALGDLHASAGGSRWKRSDGWVTAAAGTPTDFCSGPSFYGAQCDGGRNLVRLQLSGNGLVGYLASSFGALSLLQLLDLSSNNLSGSLPSSFASLSSLTGLSLSDSGLCGTVPSAFQPNDGRLPSCPPQKTSAKEFAIDAAMVAGVVWGAIIAAVLIRKAWQMHRYASLRRSLSEDPEEAAPRAAEEDAFYEAAPGEEPSSVDEENAARLEAALHPPSVSRSWLGF